MNALNEVKDIVENQKSVRTSRLQPLIKQIEMMYINQGNKIRKQKRQLKVLRIIVERKRRKGNE